MSLEDFSWPLSFAGVVLVCFSLTIYPRLIQSIGPVSLARFGLLFGISGALLMPASSFMPGETFRQVLSTLDKHFSAASHRILNHIPPVRQD